MLQSQNASTLLVSILLVFIVIAQSIHGLQFLRYKIILQIDTTANIIQRLMKNMQMR